MEKNAQLWKEGNGFEYLRELRKFFDSKGNWDTAVIQKRLKISEQEVGELMRALGYELIGNEWMLGQSKKANTRRNKWLASEERFKDIEV